MNLTFIPGIARIIPAAILTMGLGTASLKAATNVTIGLAGKSFGHGQNLHLESTGLLDPSKAYTIAFQGTLQGTGIGAFLEERTFSALLERINPGSSATLTKVKQNDAGTLPVAQLFNQTYSGTLPASKKRNRPAITFTLTISSRIDASGKVFTDIKNIEIITAAGPVDGVFTFGLDSNVKVHTAPEIRFNLASNNVNEDKGPLKVKVVRWGYIQQAASASYSMMDGTAVGGRDYTKSSGTVSFAAGITEAFITIPITDTTANDGKRSFTVNLSNPSSGAAIGSIPSTTVNIFNVN